MHAYTAVIPLHHLSPSDPELRSLQRCTLPTLAHLIEVTEYEDGLPLSARDTAAAAAQGEVDLC